MTWDQVLSEVRADHEAEAQRAAILRENEERRAQIRATNQLRDATYACAMMDAVPWRKCCYNRSDVLWRIEDEQSGYMVELSPNQGDGLVWVDVRGSHGSMLRKPMFDVFDPSDFSDANLRKLAQLLVDPLAVSLDWRASEAVAS